MIELDKGQLDVTWLDQTLEKCKNDVAMTVEINFEVIWRGNVHRSV